MSTSPLKATQKSPQGFSTPHNILQQDQGSKEDRPEGWRSPAGTDLLPQQVTARHLAQHPLTPPGVEGCVIIPTGDTKTAPHHPAIHVLLKRFVRSCSSLPSCRREYSQPLQYRCHRAPHPLSRATPPPSCTSQLSQQLENATFVKRLSHSPKVK